MTGTIGHLRNVADLVAALNIEAILAEARLASHESATDLALEVEAGVAALREVAALVEEATAADAIVSDQYGAFVLAAVRADRWDLANALLNFDDDKASEADLALIREALAEKTLTVEEAPRCVSSDDSRAVLRAWGGADEHNATLDMGGWTGDEETAGDFLAAVQAEAIRGTGSPLAYVVIEDRDGVAVEEATAEEEENDAPLFTTRQVHDLADEAARAGGRETVEACEAYLDNPEAGWAADIIDEALSYARAMQ